MAETRCIFHYARRVEQLHSAEVVGSDHKSAIAIDLHEETGSTSVHASGANLYVIAAMRVGPAGR